MSNNRITVRTRRFEASTLGSIFVLIFLFGFLSIFPLAGLFILFMGIRDLTRGQTDWWIQAGFACVWLLFCAFLIWVVVRSRRAQADGDSDFVPSRARRPGKREERIRGVDAGWNVVGIGCGLVFGGAGLACLIASLRNANMEGRNIGIGLGSVFLLLGLLFLTGAIMVALHRRKFGVASLRLPNPPGRIGGRLDGVVEIPMGILRDDSFKIHLTCASITVTRRGGDKSDSVSRQSLWIGEQILRNAHPKPDGSAELPFSFKIPSRLPESYRGNPSIEWRLDVSASVPGLDFRESFAVPVLEGAGLQPSMTSERGLPTRDIPRHPAGGEPFQAQPDWAAGRIEADRRVGPVWPGMTGIGIVPLGAAGLLSAAPSVAGRLQRLFSILGMLIMAGFIASMFTRGHGMQFLETIPQVYSRLLTGLTWVAMALGGGFAMTAGLRTWHQYWHLHRFGISFLRLASLPVKPGTTMRGSLEIPRSVVPEGGFSFRLLCVRMRWFHHRFSGAAAKVGWTGDWIAHEGYTPADGQTEVPFELAVPKDLPESGAGAGSWQWYVEVRAPVPGLDYIVRFAVPVRHAR